MNDLERKHYTWLKEKYHFLIKIIMGSDYYTNSMHVFDADMEAFYDMEKKVDKLKYDLKMYKRLFHYMLLIVLSIIISLVIK